MRNQSEQNHNHNQSSSSVDPAPSTPSDSESVIDRIKRRSYYCRFNEKKPKRTSSIVGPTAQREYYRDMANKSKPRSSDYLLSSNGFQTESEGSFSRAGSKSPTPMNVPSSIHFKENSSRANTPGCYSMIDENDKYKTQPQYHYHFRQRSQTPSRSTKSPFDNNEGSQAKSSEYLNLRSTLTSPPASKYYSNPSPSSLPTSDYQHNGNRSYALRNSAYDSLSPPIYSKLPNQITFTTGNDFGTIKKKIQLLNFDHSQVHTTQNDDCPLHTWPQPSQLPITQAHIQAHRKII